jgi:hypothetical protein
MTKEEQRKSILKLLKKGSISLDDALDMLEASDCSNGESIITSYQKQTYTDAIEQIVKETINDMNVDSVVKIMQDMNWTYGINDELVTRESVVDCMEGNVRRALEELVKSKIEYDYASAWTSTGGFQCRAWVDDGDDDNIQVELTFQPYTAFGDGHLDTLIKLKKEENSNK